MLALVAAVERSVARAHPAFTTLHAAAWRRSGEVVGQAARCPVAALGDSLVKHGFVPAAAAEGSGRPAYNLAVPKGMFPAHDVLFRRLLRGGGRPSALVVDGEMLGENPFANERIWPELLAPAESAELAWAGRDPAFLARLLLAEALPSYRERNEVRQALLLALEGKALTEPPVVPIVWRNWRRNAGAELLPDRNDPPGTDPRPEELERKGYRPVDWPWHPVNVAYATRLLERAQARGVAVFWLLPPYHSEVEARRERYGCYPKYVAFLRGLVARYPNLTVVDGRGAGYPPGALADMTHLSRTGALTFSAAVGRLIADRLDGRAPGGWVRLPRYDAPAAAALAAASGAEDVPTSARELDRVMRERRRLRREARLAGAPATDADRRRH
jgi:hypothetical protein